MGCVNSTGVKKDYKNLEETKNENNQNKATIKEKEAPEEVSNNKSKPSPMEQENRNMQESIIKEDEPREVLSEKKNTDNVPIQQKQEEKPRRPDPTINEIKSQVYDDIMTPAS